MWNFLLQPMQLLIRVGLLAGNGRLLLLHLHCPLLDCSKNRSQLLVCFLLSFTIVLFQLLFLQLLQAGHELG